MFTSRLAVKACLAAPGAPAAEAVSEERLEQQIMQMQQQLDLLKSQQQQLKLQNEALAAQQQQQAPQDQAASAALKGGISPDLSLWGYGEMYLHASDP